MNDPRGGCVSRGMIDSCVTSFELRRNGATLVGGLYPILAALSLGRTRTVPLDAVGNRVADPGDVVELVIASRAGTLRHVGVVHATPQRELLLSFAFVDPSDWVAGVYYYGAPQRPEDLAAVFEWGAHVPEWRRAQAAFRAVQVAFRRHGPRTTAARHLYERLDAPDARGVRQAVEGLRAAATVLTVDGQRPSSLRDMIREAAARATRQDCVDFALFALGQSEVSRRLGAEPAQYAEAVLWALAALAGDHDAQAAVARAVQIEIPFNAYVAALAGVIEDDLGY